jgi:hypothetical protein
MSRLSALSAYTEQFTAALTRLGTDPHARDGFCRRARAWMETGASAADAALWEHRGITPEQAQPHIDRDVDPTTFLPEENGTTPEPAYGDRPEDYIV